MSEDTRSIQRAYDELRDQFPFPRVLDPQGESQRFIASAIERLRPQRGRLLDLGAGPLDNTALLAKLGFSCFACDDYQDPWHRRDQNLLRIREFAKASGITLHVHENGDYTIPFPKNSFDVVCVLAVIEHLHESPRNMLNTAGQMLVPNGVLVVVMPNAVNLRKRLAVAVGRSNYPDVEGFFASEGTWRGHVREYTLLETEYILKAAGFRIIRSQTFHGMLQARIRSKVLRGFYRALTAIVPGLRDSLFVAAERPAEWAPAEYDDGAFRRAIARSVPAGIVCGKTTDVPDRPEL